jgi:RNA polymerase sigma-70 factor (ECF subfamily)
MWWQERTTLRMKNKMKITPLTDESTLICLAQAGDLDAFNQIVLAYQDRLFNVAFYLLHSEESAADAVQNALIKSFRNLHSFRGGPIYPWLVRILKNGCIDELRRRKRYPLVPLEPLTKEDDPVEDATWMADFSTDPARICELRELSRTIFEIIQRIPTEYQLPLVLVDIEGMDYAQAASVVGIHLNTFKSRLSRARAKVCRLLGESSHNNDFHLSSVHRRGDADWSANRDLAA